MEVQIFIRFKDSIEATGELVILWPDSKIAFSCNVLKRSNVVQDGTYQCKWSFMHDLNEAHYEVCNVPGHEGIFIHEGNHFTDTKGCILLGNALININDDGEMDVINSKMTLKTFEELLNKAPFKLTITTSLKSK